VALVEEGNRAFARGEFAAAAAKYEQALVEGTEPELLLNRGLALYRSALESSGSERDEAMARAESALAKVGNSRRPWLRARALTALGNLYLQRDDLSDATAAYRRALTSDPANQAARHNLELALRRLAEKQADAEEQGGQASDDPEGGQAAATSDPTAGEGPKDDPAATGPEDPGGEEPVGPDEPGADEASPNAQEAGPRREDSPRAASSGDVSDLERKLDSLERRSRGLRRELLGKKKLAQPGGPPW